VAQASVKGQVLVAPVGKLTPKQVKRRFEQLKTDRITWESLWQECTDYFLPNRNDVTRTYTDGQKRNTKLFDNTGIQSNELLSGALHGLLTNPNAQWFELTTGEEELDNEDDVRFWLQESTTTLHNVLNNSNFQTEVHQLYLDECCIGTAGMSVLESDDTVVNFGARHIKELYVAENNKGIIDELFRLWQWNARQIVDEFGEDNLSPHVKKAYEKGDNRKFWILHAIYPRRGQNFSEANPKKMQYVSQYIMLEEEFEISESGFREFPYVVPRWTKCSGETYGRSPAMNALPDMKTLNEMTRTVLVGAQKVVDPPLQLPDDGFIMPIRTRAGGLNYYRAGSNDRIVPVFNNAQIDFGFQATQERRARIREAFYVDQLQLSQGPQMTATEVMQRTEERTRLLGPMLGRQQSEFLRPLIDRVFEICLRKNIIKKEEIPQALSGKKIDVKYSSLIAKSQRISEGQNIQRTLQAATPFIQMDQTVVDNLNGDEALKIIARIYGLPQKMIRTDKEVKQIRGARAQAQQQAIKQQQEQHQADVTAKMAPAAAQLQQATG
jgi:hypothetical protein